MTFIKNAEALASHGSAAARRAVLSIIEHGLVGADPYRATRRLLHLDGERLLVGDLAIDLSGVRRIFVLGAGKASYPIARAAEEVLGDRISDGIVICKYGQEGKLRRSSMLLAAHPIPDQAGLEGARRTLALARQTEPGDVVLACYTGGSSALLPYPVAGVSLEEKRAVNRHLLSCGANIVEINAVRKHLSQIKGGRLAAAIDPQAQLVTLTVSDVIGDPLDVITDPTVPDSSTLDDARGTLTKYELWDRVPISVASFLRRAGPNEETAKEADFLGRNRFDHILVSADAACIAAAEAAEAAGFETMILSTMLEGESSELGRTFAAIAKEIVQKQRPLRPPCAFIAGGETTVRLDDKFGQGGPNQEFALAAAAEIAGLDQVVIAAIDSDGTDGPTEMAGGLVDGHTLKRAQDAGIDLHTCLKQHDATQALVRLGEAVETGATGTNVNDLKLLLVMGRR
jgi:hydroxypyruvate reductase/glycerate 2-kinase